MNPLTLALVWHHYRLNIRVWIVWVFSLLVTSVFLACLSSYMPEASGEFTTVFLTTMGIACVLSASWLHGIHQPHNFVFGFNFWMPVSTRRLALIPFLLTLGQACMLFFLSVCVFRWVSGLNLPFGKTTSIIAILTSALIAVSWGIRFVNLRILLIVIVMSVGSLGLSRLIHLESSNPSLEFQVPLIESWLWYLLVGLGITLLSAASVYGVHYQRHRAELANVGLHSWGRGLSLVRKSKAVPLQNHFRHPFYALVWHERSKIGNKPFVWQFVVCLAVAVFVSVMGLFEGTSGKADDLLFYIIITTLLGFFIHIELGTLMTLVPTFSAKKVQLAAYESTKPVPTEQLVFSRLVAVLINTAIGSFLGTVFVAAFYLALNHQGLAENKNWQPLISFLLNLGFRGIWLLIFPAVFVIASASSLLTALMIYGAVSKKRALAILSIVIAIGPVIALDAEQGWGYGPILIAMANLLALFLIINSVFLGRRAFTQGLIGPSLTGLIFIFGCISLLSTLAALHLGLPGGWRAIPWSAWIPILAGFCVPTGMTIALPQLTAQLRHE